MARVKHMLAKLFNTPTRERPNPDPIAASLVIARQRNESAGEKARQALAEMLERNDSVRKGR